MTEKITSGHKVSNGDENVNSIDVWSDPVFDKTKIKRSEMLEFGDDCFLLKNVMTSAECHHYVTSAENIGFDEIPEAPISYRNSVRTIFRSEELSTLLWERIRPYLNDIVIHDDPHAVHIHGAHTLLRGTWKPLKINNMFRLMRYAPGGHFAPHFDGHIVESANVRSMKTFLLYLNDGFEGGSTNIIDEKQLLYKNDEGKFCAEEKNILFRIKPEAGMVNLFNHHLLHEGKQLSSGYKYIIRTDVMYKIDKQSADKKDTEALLLAQEAERLEAAGRMMEAVSFYRKAFKMSAAVATSYGCPP